MTLDEECRLSYYQQIAVLNEEHQVILVQHSENHRVYVRKTLTNYDADIFRTMKEHPVEGIPRIFELIEDVSGLIIIEEYISGESLQERLDRMGCLSETAAMDVIRQLCRIVHQLHSMDPPVIHRDIKPSNLIVTPAGEVRLLDLDAAKHMQDNQSRDTVLLGTQGFAAPEQYGFGSSGISTDIYSIGVLLNVLLTGQFPSEKMAEGKAREIIEKCTQINPKDRYRSVLELMTVLQKGKEDTAIFMNPPVTGWRRFLPPGFRRGNPICMVTAIMGYLLLFYTSAFFVSKDGTAQPTILDRITMFLAGILIILFSCNYLNIQEKTGIGRISGRYLKIVIVLAIDIIIPIVLVTVMIIFRRLLEA